MCTLGHHVDVKVPCIITLARLPGVARAFIAMPIGVPKNCHTILTLPPKTCPVESLTYLVPTKFQFCILKTVRMH